MLIHLICWGLAATVLVQQAVTGDWRGADAPSGTVSKLSTTKACRRLQNCSKYAYTVLSRRCLCLRPSCCR
ncbi:MAG: hypothetical protein WCR59_07235, partial [Planctomycetota bacterium]